LPIESKTLVLSGCAKNLPDANLWRIIIKKQVKGGEMPLLEENRGEKKSERRIKRHKIRNLTIYTMLVRYVKLPHPPRGGAAFWYIKIQTARLQ
jgi:hypothetical protein